MKNMKKKAMAAAAFLLLCAIGVYTAANNRMVSAASFVMDAVVDQKGYGWNAQKAIHAAEKTFRQMEKTLSLYEEKSDIARINRAAGSGEGVAIEASTYALLEQAKQLGKSGQEGFCITIAPLSLAWGITSDAPRVPETAQIRQLLDLVNDDDLILEAGTARLRKKGQAIDLGGIAKGAACDAAKQVYDQYGVRSALCWIGGSSIYARGTKPNGEPWRLGFRDPAVKESVSVASFEIKDAVFCTSGGYERNFEKDGVQYHHILDPKTGYPVKSDIVSIGVLCENGAEADFRSTSLFVQGKQAALSYFENGGEGLLLDEEGVLYVSRGLQSSFRLSPEYEGRYRVINLE